MDVELINMLAEQGGVMLLALVLVYLSFKINEERMRDQKRHYEERIKEERRHTEDIDAIRKEVQTVLDNHYNLIERTNVLLGEVASALQRIIKE